MFKKLITKVRQVMYRMGLIKGLKNLNSKPNVEVNEELYEYIEKWKALYKGYFSEVHDVTEHTLNGKKKRRRATLNMPKVLSQELASLVFNEKCEISISDEAFSENVKEVFKCNNFYKEFQRYLEYEFAMGGRVIKAYVVNGEIKLSYVTADCFVPIQWDNKGVHGGIFVHEFKRGDKYYTHLEWHFWEVRDILNQETELEEAKNVYVIKNEVYESAQGTDLGVKVTLQDFFPDLEEEVIVRNARRHLFVYSKPNIANNFDTSSPLGISVFANALDTLKSLDIAFDSFQREFRLGKKRILIPATALRVVNDPDTGEKKRYFDADDEVFQAFKYGDDSHDITDISVELRVDEHVSAINSLLNLLATQTGFSAGAFSFDGQVVKTATEVVSENSKTFRTKQSHETTIEGSIQELVAVVAEIADLYGIFPGPSKDNEVTVGFDDSIAEDQTAEINKQVQLVMNGLNSKKRALMKVHKITEEEAEELLKEINEERASNSDEDVDLFGVGQ